MSRKKSTFKDEFKDRGTHFCSFCGKGEAEVATLIASDPIAMDATAEITLQNGQCAVSLPCRVTFITHICDACVGICAEILQEYRKGAPAATDTPKPQGEIPHE